MAAGAEKKCVHIFTNRKLPSVHSESLPRSRTKASTYRRKNIEIKAYFVEKELL